MVGKQNNYRLKNFVINADLFFLSFNKKIRFWQDKKNQYI